MIDISWDFDMNDVAILNGDFETTVDSSNQNAALILMKQAVSVVAPQYGVGFESYYANAPHDFAVSLAGEAKRQIENDGATICTVSIDPLSNGSYTINVTAKYPN